MFRAGHGMKSPYYSLTELSFLFFRHRALKRLLQTDIIIGNVVDHTQKQTIHFSVAFMHGNASWFNPQL